jgi:hypothetical protein
MTDQKRPEDELEGGPRAAREGADDTAQRANELAHRAVQEAELALRRRKAGLLTDVEREQLEETVERARQMVRAAQMTTDYAQASRVLTTLRREAVATRESRRKQGERATRGFISIVTWGRRRARCGACGEEFVVAYRCSTHEPVVETSVHCAVPGCSALVTCHVPASAYAFVTRRIKTRGGGG